MQEFLLLATAALRSLPHGIARVSFLYPAEAGR